MANTHQPLAVTRGLDGLSAELHCGSRVLSGQWALLPALVPAALVGAVLGPLRNGDVWIAAGFVLLGLVLVLAGFGLYVRASAHPHGTVRLRVDGGAVTVEAPGSRHPDVRYRGHEAGTPLPLAELVDAWAGVTSVDGTDVPILVLRFTGNRYVELPAARHAEADLAELADEIKGLGRAAEARSGSVPDAIRRLRQSEVHR